MLTIPITIRQARALQSGFAALCVPASTTTPSVGDHVALIEPWMPVGPNEIAYAADMRRASHAHPAVLAAFRDPQSDRRSPKLCGSETMPAEIARFQVGIVDKIVIDLHGATHEHASRAGIPHIEGKGHGIQGQAGWRGMGYMDPRGYYHVDGSNFPDRLTGFCGCAIGQELRITPAACALRAHAHRDQGCRESQIVLITVA